MHFRQINHQIKQLYIVFTKRNVYSFSDIGDEGMEVLMKLSTIDINNSSNIDDQRLTANGFSVKVSKGNNFLLSVCFVCLNNA